MIADIAAAVLERLSVGDGGTLLIDGAVPKNHPGDLNDVTLSDLLYTEFYIRRRRAARNTRSKSDFMEELRDANAARDTFHEGWHVDAGSNHGGIVARHGALQRRCAPGEYLARAPGKGLAVGDRVSLFMPSDSTTLSDYFYFAFGTTVTDEHDWSSMTRYYFNVSSHGVVGWLRYLTSALTTYQVPYRLKCPNNPANYVRADALVVYLPRAYHSIMVQIACDAAPRALYDSLVLEEPLFTKRLRPGIALAEDPGGQLSFGQHRSLVLGRALIDIWTGEMKYNPTKHVEQSFRAAGIDPLKPYLNAASHDIYHQ
jgi:hypothetical protein